MKDNTPQCVKAVLDKPGKYQFKGHGITWFFEVDEKRNVHQLNIDTMKRDGILSKDGWNSTAAYGVVTRVEEPT